MRTWLCNKSTKLPGPRLQPHRARPLVSTSQFLVAMITCAALMSGASEAASAGAANAKSKLSEVEQFCVNIADTAADTRYALQKRELEKLEANVAKRLELLNERIAEYKDWAVKRKKFAEMAKEKLVAIYSKMRTEAASEQIALMDNLTAASLIAKLPTKQASTILGEMDAKKAASIASTVRYASETTKRGSAKQ